MKGYLLFLLCLAFTFSTVDTFAKSKKGRKYTSNVYVSKKYKGHTCPKPRKIINNVNF